MQIFSRASQNAASTEPNPFIRRLQSIAALNEEELEALRRLPIVVRSIPRGQDIARDGERPTSCSIVLEGFAFRYKTLSAGRRQIVSFHTPGDVPDLQSLHLKVMDHSLAALSVMKAGFIRHADVRELCRRHPRIASVLWRETLIDGAIFREWLTGIGRRDAPTRIAHLLCELYARLEAVGLAGEGAMKLPITQIELADALGLTDVHVNRSLALIKAQGMLTLAGGILTIVDWAGLKRLGEFDPAYLHLNPSAEIEPV